MTLATFALSLGLIIQNTLNDSAAGGAFAVVVLVGALALVSVYAYLRHVQERARLAQLDYELSQRITPPPDPLALSAVVDPHATQPVSRDTARVEIKPLEPPPALNEDIMVLALELKRLRSRQDLMLGLVALTAVIAAGAFGLGFLTNQHRTAAGSNPAGTEAASADLHAAGKEHGDTPTSSRPKPVFRSVKTRFLEVC